MKIKIEMTKMETEQTIAISKRMGLSEIGSKKEEKEITKFGVMNSKIEDGENSVIEFDFKEGFVLEVIDCIGEFADAIIGFAKSMKYMLKAFKNRFSKWEDTHFETIAKAIYEKDLNFDSTFIIWDTETGFDFDRIDFKKPKEALQTINNLELSDTKYAIVCNVNGYPSEQTELIKNDLISYLFCEEAKNEG